MFGMLFIVPIQSYCEAVAQRRGAEPASGVPVSLLQAQSVAGRRASRLAPAYLEPPVVPRLPVGLHHDPAGSAAGARIRPGRRCRAWLASCASPGAGAGAAGLFFGVLAAVAALPEDPRPGRRLVPARRILTVFLLGYAVARQAAFWERIQRARWTTLPVALVLASSLELRCRGGRIPAGHDAASCSAAWGRSNVWRARSTCGSALLAIFAWGTCWLPAVPLAAVCHRGGVPWYILHQSLIVLLAFLADRWTAVRMEPLLVIAGTSRLPAAARIRDPPGRLAAAAVRTQAQAQRTGAAALRRKLSAASSA